MSMDANCTVAEAVSTHGETVRAAEEVLSEVRDVVGTNPDLVFLFFTAHHRDNARVLLNEVLRGLAPDAMAGGTVSGVVGSGQEHQAGPGVSLWAARIPGSRVQSFHLGHDSGQGMVHGWPDLGAGSSAAMLADPFSFPVHRFFASLRRKDRYPALFGGLLSGASRQGGNLLIHDDELREDGAVGIAVDGRMRFLPLVSQGCSPVGPVFEVTRAEQNVVYELAGRSAYDGLSEMLSMLDDEERRRFMRAPHVGIQAVPNDSGEQTGDYLVRPVMGVDPQEGAIAFGDDVGAGLAVQFQARDRDSADRDLRDALALASAYHPNAGGALMFPCTGRGVHLFQESDHDITALHRYWPDLPAGGAFAAGEIGPVCGRPYVHGLSTSIGLLVPVEE
jgi:small ligand-binding sensory domain FIST